MFRPSQDSSVRLGSTSREQLMSPGCSMQGINKNNSNNLNQGFEPDFKHTSARWEQLSSGSGCKKNLTK